LRVAQIAAAIGNGYDKMGAGFTMIATQTETSSQALRLENEIKNSVLGAG